MGHPRTTPKVLAALVQRRGRDVSIQELATASGLNDAQVRSAMRSLKEREGQPITVIQRGAMWRLETDNTAAPGKTELTDEVFEKVGESKSGEVIVRGDATETLYRVTPL